jgi:hypothetical protein
VTLDPDGYLADIHGPLGTWFGAVGTKMSSTSNLKWVKANHIGADGLYVDSTTSYTYDYGTPIPGGVAQSMPGFCTLAYTWETGVLRGPGHRGRIYPPNCVYAPATAFTVGASQRDNNAANGAGLLAVLKNTGGVDGRRGTPCVASKVNGAVTPITGCSSDDVMDVQRRRKNRVKPTRSAVVAFA